MVDEWSHEATLDLLRQLAPVEAGQPPRIIATASPNIDLRAARGEIPPELYFRLAVITIRCPPLRDHPDDILPLLEHFLTLHGNSFGKVPPKPTGAQREQLIQHGWPGNVREVANLAERAVVLGHDAFNMPIRPAMSSVLPLSTLSEGFNLTEHLEQIERDLLAKAIEQTGGDRPAVGRLLGLERNTLRYKLNKYNLLDRS
jgi:DNA-binding NtrC family response regulator